MSADGHRVSPDDIGRLLESYRPYLLSIANGELPAALQGKVGASDLVQEAILRGYRYYGTYQGTTDEELAGLISVCARTMEWLHNDLHRTPHECDINERITKARAAFVRVEVVERGAE